MASADIAQRIYERIKQWLTPTTFQRRRNALLLHWSSWRMQRFGLPFDEGGFGGAQPPGTAALGTLPSHRVLHEEQKLYYQSDIGWQLEINAIIRDEQGRFWLVLYHSYIPPRQNDVILLQAPAVLRINELRARRALFNTPDAYQRAFGEPADYQRLQAWRKRHPEQEQRDDRKDSGW